MKAQQKQWNIYPLKQWFRNKSIARGGSFDNQGGFFVACFLIRNFEVTSMYLYKKMISLSSRQRSVKGKVRSKMKLIISTDVEARNFIVHLLFSFEVSFVSGWRQGRLGAYSSPLEHASPSRKVKHDFFGDFWHL